MFGLPGITAGKRLVEKGVTDILYLEGRDEIGGRMSTHNFNGIIIERGANWIEGVGGPELNPLIPLARKINLINTYSKFDNVSNNIYDAKYAIDVHSTDQEHLPLQISPFSASIFC